MINTDRKKKITLGISALTPKLQEYFSLEKQKNSFELRILFLNDKCSNVSTILSNPPLIFNLLYIYLVKHTWHYILCKFYFLIIISNNELLKYSQIGAESMVRVGKILWFMHYYYY